MNDREIIVICGMQIAQMAYEMCRRADLEGMIRASCDKRDPLIALKPNLVGPIPASEGATTHPEIVEGVTEYLRDAGFGNLIMMESSWVGDTTQDSLLVTGFGDLSNRLSVPFVDLQSDSAVSVDCAGMRLNVCRKALGIDFLVNLPVMKGHCQTGMTCALKNMKGCIPGTEKRRFHRMGLHEPIGHLSAGLKQGFILADAICPDLTFEDGGNPVQLSRLLCARDPVLMDAYACYVMGIREEDVPYIRIAEECGVGKRNLTGASITYLLEKTEEGKPEYMEAGQGNLRWAGDSGRMLKVKELVREVDSCSACYGSLIPVLHALQEEGALRDIPGKLCIGQGWRGKQGKAGDIGIGSCTSHFETSLAGCPPSQEAMEQFLRAHLSEPKRLQCN